MKRSKEMVLLIKKYNELLSDIETLYDVLHYPIEWRSEIELLAINSMYGSYEQYQKLAMEELKELYKEKAKLEIEIGKQYMLEYYAEY